MEKKNIAFCISGSLRSLEYCYKNFIEMIYNKNKEDFNIKLFYYIPDDINKSKIELINHLNPVVVIKKDITLPNLNLKGWYGRPTHVKRDNVSQGGIDGYLQQLYGIEKSYELMTKYENDNNIKFDIILRIRSDVVFKTPLDINIYEMNKIYVPKFHYWDGINDRFALGPSNLMSVYMKMYTNIYDLANKTNLVLTKAEQFCMINLRVNNIPYKMCDEIKFCRIKMTGEVFRDC